MADLVSVADAAKRLTAAGDKIDRSGLSHYLKRHAAALPTTKPSGRLTLVDYDALTAHRRAHLGKDLAVKGPAAFALSLADEQQGKLRADRLLALDRLAKRKADLIPMWCVGRQAHVAWLSMWKATDVAAAQTAAVIAAEQGGTPEAIRMVLVEHGRHAHEAMERVLREAGFLSLTIEQLREMAWSMPPDEQDPPEPQNLDEERAAKARMDRLRQELKLQQKRRLLIPLQEATFALVDALQQARQALAAAAHEGAEALARAAGVEPVFVRPYPRQHERRVLALFREQLDTFKGRPG